MAKQAANSEFFKKVGSKLPQAHKAHKDDDTDYGNVELPAGIEGIAQLVECKVDKVKEGKKNAGQFYFYAAGVVVKPSNHEGLPILGLRTSIMEMMCDTPDAATKKTFADHYGWVLNELAKLGVDRSTMAEDGSDFETTLAALKEAKPFFRFRTWKGPKQTTGQYAGQEPRVNHQWQGAVEYESDGSEVSGAVEDETPKATALNPTAAKEDEVPFDDGAGSEATESTVDQEAAAIEESDADNIDTLIEQANNGDSEAGEKLTAMAEGAGATKKQIEDAPDWNAVAALINAGNKEPEAEASAEPEQPFLPAKEEIYKYQVIDAKTKKPVMDTKTKKPKKAIEVEVVAVNTKAKTVDLKNVDDGKTIYKAVPWDALESAE